MAQIINAALTPVLIGWILTPIVGLWTPESTKLSELHFRALLTDSASEVSFERVAVG